MSCDPVLEVQGQSWICADPVALETRVQVPAAISHCLLTPPVQLTLHLLPTFPVKMVPLHYRTILYTTLLPS